MSAADARYADEYFATIRPDLRPFRKVPRADPPEGVRARMAEFLQHRYAAAGQITRDDLVAAGFTAPDIDRHFPDALTIARLPQMVA